MLLNQSKQAVSGASDLPVYALLAEYHPPSLAAWYGDPIMQGAAEALYARAQSELQSRLCKGDGCFALHVLQLICHFWTGAAAGMEFARLGVPAPAEREAALLHLCYGQLLMSCKLRPAMQYLKRGFSLAVPYLESSEYFSLVRQHELLACLHLAETPSPPSPLQNLLAEAAVIRRLQQGDRNRNWKAHLDTVG